MKKYTILSLLVIGSFSSCTKLGKNVTVKGRVLNPVTGQGIAGAEIWLQKSSGGYERGYKPSKKTSTMKTGITKSISLNFPCPIHTIHNCKFRISLTSRLFFPKLRHDPCENVNKC